MPETAKERWERAQQVSNKAYQEYLAEQTQEIGPETEVWVSHNLLLTKKMTLKDLALQIRQPVSALIDSETSIKYADTVVERNAQWIDPVTLPDSDEWEVEEDGWSVTEVQ